MKVDWLVIHTAAAADEHGNIVRGITIDDIRRWHLAKGWSDIGYHYVIEDGGMVSPGRPEDRPGAHVRGLNDRSLGICVTGHGDIEDFNLDQYFSLYTLLNQLCRKYHIYCTRVIGHREAHLKADVPDPHKTCPGVKVNMDHIRETLSSWTGAR